MTSNLICPVCGSSLEITNNSYQCVNRHSFDIAKEGYVNLSPASSQKSSGDDKEMVKARTRFLDKGFYSPLRQCLCSLISEAAVKEPVILDSGCGEGYYTSAFCETAQKTGAKVIGIDLSKSAVKHGAKRCRNAEFAVASVFHLPVAENSVDIIVNCFSPMADREFARVLKKGGYLIYVVPGAKHLWELKNVLYDNPYENVEKLEQYEDFELIKVENVKTDFVLDSASDIMDLFHMTPYTWNTPKECALRLENLSELYVSAEFNIHLFRRI